MNRVEYPARLGPGTECSHSSEPAGASALLVLRSLVRHQQYQTATHKKKKDNKVHIHCMVATGPYITLCL